MRPVHWGVAATLLAFAAAGASLLSLQGSERLAFTAVSGAVILLSLPVSLMYEARDWWKRRRPVSTPPRPGRRPLSGQSYVTLRGDVVRSLGEVVIADYLFHHGVKYRYEEPALSRYRRRPFARPDFYLPKHDLFIEYWGLVDHPDSATRERYERNMRSKMARYYNNGIKFISLYPSDLNDLDRSLRRKAREATGRELAGR